MSKVTENLRDEINLIIKELNLSDEDFQLVRLTRYEQILDSILVKFTSPKPSQINRWWWNYFIEPVYSICPENVFYVLSGLINKNECLWLVIEDENKTNEHYWLYEGRISAIIQVLKELSFMEYYIVSKNLEWIICENHHNYLTGCGETIVEKMKVLKPQTKKST